MSLPPMIEMPHFTIWLADEDDYERYVADKTNSYDLNDYGQAAPCPDPSDVHNETFMFEYLADGGYHELEYID